jgi:hypothetical protein
LTVVVQYDEPISENPGSDIEKGHGDMGVTAKTVRRLAIVGTAAATTLGVVATLSFAEADVSPPSQSNPHPASTVERGWTPRMQWIVDELAPRHEGEECGGQADGGDSGHVKGSDHYTGNAADCMVTAQGTVAEGDAKAMGDAIAWWSREYADQLAVKYVIWHGRIWTRRTGDFVAYCNPGLTQEQCDHPDSATEFTLQHYDHVHISALTP